MFDLTKEQCEKLAEWKKTKNLDKYVGAIGGRFTYSFCPTSLGIITIVTDDLDKTEIDLTDYSW